MPDTVGSEQHEPTFLRGIANKAQADKQHRFRDLYRCLNADFLLHCWDELNQDAASGVDGVTAAEYAQDLPANLQALAERVKSKQYRAKLVRRVYIPKENGKERPIGIPALEDKLVQLACVKLLNAIYEAEFLDCSYGYRPGRGALEAVQELTFGLQYGVYGYVAEADICGFFDHLDHDKLLEMLRLRIDDRAFLGLIRKLRGHYNYYGLRGNDRSLKRFYDWAIECTFKWLNRRGGKRRSFNWTIFIQALDRMKVMRPCITEVKRRRKVA